MVGTSPHAHHLLSTPALVGVCAAVVTILLALLVGIYRCFCRPKRSVPYPSVRTPPENSGKTSLAVKSATPKSPLVTPTSEGEAPFPEKKAGSKSYSSTSSSIEPHTINTQWYIENESEKKSEDSKQAWLKGENEESAQLGNLFFSVEYDFDKNAFMVTLHSATDLPVKDPTTNSSDPYIKLCLLPEKKHKVKTRVLRKTLNPVYEETFTFYGLHYNQLQGITLHFVVLSFDRFSRDDVIGEIVVPLANIDMSETAVHLSRDIKPRNPKVLRNQGHGDLLVSLSYQPAANRLTVVVLKARNLPKMDVTGLSDPYVKIHLMYNNQRLAKKKTRLKKRTLNPVFNESFLFDVPIEGLQNVSLEFQILDHDRVTKNEIIGRLVIGAKASGEEEKRHWKEITENPRKQIAEWHKLSE
ncbi:synaptotagmin-11-like [Ptychodera flava]|uniref:synaptotagmin-11-like n=1 Tax=Ptychodera flava TaxID=63121 RepID=UPI003969D93E